MLQVKCIYWLALFDKVNESREKLKIAPWLCISVIMNDLNFNTLPHPMLPHYYYYYYYYYYYCAIVSLLHASDDHYHILFPSFPPTGFPRITD